MTMPDQVEVTQEDREAAAERIAIWGDVEAATEAHKVRQGEWDGHGFVQAFARHRQAAIQKARADALEGAYDKLRGTNADLCKTPGAAYRLMLDTLRSLTESEVSREG